MMNNIIKHCLYVLMTILFLLYVREVVIRNNKFAEEYNKEHECPDSCKLIYITRGQFKCECDTVK